MDRVPVEKADLTKLRKRISLVSQDTVIFAESVMDNIRYGTPNATDEQVRQAARRRTREHLHRAASARLWHASRRARRRAFGRPASAHRHRARASEERSDPALDEATSALDQESEKLVQTALESVMHGRTTLVIAHRLATVINADRILVIDGGLPRRGRHARLAHQCGRCLFAACWLATRRAGECGARFLRRPGRGDRSPQCQPSLKVKP